MKKNLFFRLSSVLSVIALCLSLVTAFSFTVCAVELPDIILGLPAHIGNPYYDELNNNKLGNFNGHIVAPTEITARYMLGRVGMEYDNAHRYVFYYVIKYLDNYYYLANVQNKILSAPTFLNAINTIPSRDYSRYTYRFGNTFNAYSSTFDVIVEDNKITNDRTLTYVGFPYNSTNNSVTLDYKISRATSSGSDLFTNQTMHLISVDDGSVAEFPAPIRLDMCEMFSFCVYVNRPNSSYSYTEYEYIDHLMTDKTSGLTKPITPDYEKNVDFYSLGEWESTTYKNVYDWCEEHYNNDNASEAGEKVYMNYGFNVNTACTVYNFGKYLDYNINSNPNIYNGRYYNPNKIKPPENFNFSITNGKIALKYINKSTNTINLTIGVSLFEYTQTTDNIANKPWWWAWNYANQTLYTLAKDYGSYTSENLNNIPRDKSVFLNFNLSSICGLRNNSFYIISLFESGKLVDSVMVKYTNGSNENTFIPKDDDDVYFSLKDEDDYSYTPPSDDYGDPIIPPWSEPATPSVDFDFNNINMNNVFTSLSDMSGNLSNFFTAVYSIVPVEIMALLVAFIAVAIILRVLGR